MLLDKLHNVSMYFLRFLVTTNYNLNHRIGYWDCMQNGTKHWIAMLQEGQENQRPWMPELLDSFQDLYYQSVHSGIFLTSLITQHPGDKPWLIMCHSVIRGKICYQKRGQKHTRRTKTYLQHLSSLGLSVLIYEMGMFILFIVRIKYIKCTVPKIRGSLGWKSW